MNFILWKRKSIFFEVSLLAVVAPFDNLFDYWAFLAFSTIALKASGLFIARSASTLRLIFRVRKVLHACGSVDTLNPQCAEVALLVLTVTISIGQTLLPSVLGNGPDVLACSEITSCKFKNLFTFCSWCNVIYWSWHFFKLLWTLAAS